MVVPDLDGLRAIRDAGEACGLILVRGVDVARTDEHALTKIIKVITSHGS